MKKFIGFCAALLIIANASVGICDEYVRRYIRGDEAYVAAAHWRSSPDGNQYNDFGSFGNGNSYPDKVAPETPDRYVRPYYNPNSDDSNLSPANQYWSDQFTRLLSDATWQDDKHEH
jgi:hypothetical protein